MTKKHYRVKNTLGGEFCKKCFEWASEVGGLEGYECKATKKEVKENKKFLKHRKSLGEIT